MQIDQPVAGVTWRAEVNLVFVHGSATPAHLLDQDQQRTAEWDQFAQEVTPQQRQRHFEEGFRRGIGVDHFAVGRSDDNGMWQSVEDGLGGRSCQQRFNRDHLPAPEAEVRGAVLKKPMQPHKVR